MNKSKPIFRQSFFTYMLFLSGLGLILPTSLFSQVLPMDPKPTITSFNVTPVTEGNKGKMGGWIEFSWNTKNADRVKLYKEGREIKGREQQANGEFGWPVNLKGGLQFQNRKPTQYELVAENSIGKSSSKLHLNGKDNIPSIPNPPSTSRPKILSFKVSPQNSQPGDKVKFFWEVKEAEVLQLYDSYGKIESLIDPGKGKTGWPLSMNGVYMEHLNKSETYKLVATNKNGISSKDFVVTVKGEKSCTVNVSITGKYNKFTDAVGVFKAKPGGIGEFLFKSPISKINDHRNSKNPKTSYRARITLDPGKYTLVPSGGGKDKYGNFGVIYKAKRIGFTCVNGNTGNLSTVADFAEY